MKDGAGNDNLCGEPLGSCNPPKISPTISPPTPPAVKVSGKKSVRNSILIGSILVLVAVAFAAAFIISHLTRQQSLVLRNTAPTFLMNDHSKYAAPASYGSPVQSKSPDPHAHPKRAELLFLWDDRARFDLHDLLRASAEILGSGTFGASYKANILTDNVVVKRFKQMNSVCREDFHEHMRRLGSLTHPNLLPLVAYYYRKEEKLLVSDFVENGSLAFHLHGEY